MLMTGTISRLRSMARWTLAKRLRLHALDGIDDEKRPFAGRERAGDFISEVDVAGSIDQVDLIGLAIVGFIMHRDRVGFDRDAPLPLQIHVVEDLLLHFPVFERYASAPEAGRRWSICHGRCGR